MTFLKKYLIPRLIQFILVIFVGLTVVFIIPRLAPTGPIERTIAQLRSMGSYLDPATMDKFIEDLTEMYGLGGAPIEQYWAFWARLFKGDFGVSFTQFPTPVTQLIGVAAPWTIALILFTTIIAWTGGNIVGGLAGYYNRARWSKILDTVAMIIRPLPYYIFSFGLLLLFAYVFRLFPISGGASFGRQMEFTWPVILDVLWHATLPALSLIILGAAAWFQTMKLVVQNTNAENFVQYAKMGGIRQGRIVSRYVIRNAMLPQITVLALLIGQIFGGALITEIVFSYPGLGLLLYNAILTGDYNLIMGITALSIIGITGSILIIDLLYPLFDPRIRYS
jgi:peptide/nickel transport system permease protein